MSFGSCLLGGQFSNKSFCFSQKPVPQCWQLCVFGAGAAPSQGHEWRAGRPRLQHGPGMLLCCSRAVHLGHRRLDGVVNVTAIESKRSTVAETQGNPRDTKALPKAARPEGAAGAPRLLQWMLLGNLQGDRDRCAANHVPCSLRHRQGGGQQGGIQKGGSISWQFSRAPRLGLDV